MGLSMAERKSVTKELLRRYAKGTKTDKGRILDELGTVALVVPLREGDSRP